jgi:alkylation response protein AidB-like acyl-CoA dehydrogenase
VLGAAELVGTGHRLLERSIAYARERVQFDRPIAEFQAIQHRLADMHMHVETARTAVVMAANDADPGGHAIRHAWDNIRLVSESAVQIHGGFGFTWEAGLHFYERHVWAWRDLLDACGIPR